MRPLHSVRSVLPFEDTRLLTRELYLGLQRHDFRRGGIADIWIEGDRVLAYWVSLTERNTPRLMEPPFIINMSSDYPTENRMAWLAEDVPSYRRARNRDEWNTWHLSNENVCEERLGGDVILIEDEDEEFDENEPAFELNLEPEQG